MIFYYRVVAAQRNGSQALPGSSGKDWIRTAAVRHSGPKHGLPRISSHERTDSGTYINAIFKSYFVQKIVLLLDFLCFKFEKNYILRIYDRVKLSLDKNSLVTSFVDCKS